MKRRRPSKYRSLKKFYKQERYSVLALIMAMTQILVATSHSSASLFSLSIVIILTVLILNWWKQQQKSARFSRKSNYRSRYSRYRQNSAYQYSYPDYDYQYEDDDYPLIPLPPLKRKREYRR